MSNHILFIDPVCPKPYDDRTLEADPMGGTEASCVRIVEELAKDPAYTVTLMQRGRVEEYVSRGGVIYTPVVGVATPNPTSVVTLRDAGLYVKHKSLFPNAKHYLWMHDIVSGDYRVHLMMHLQGHSVNFICVSDFHKTNIIDQLKDEAIKGKMRVHKIYGPVAEYCTKTPTSVDVNKLVFFSSPHKGLDYVLELFKMLRRIDPAFVLYIANPGYFADKTDLPEGCVNLGSVKHRDLILNHVRGSLCTFYPNTSFPETFGLVMAESVAVGTPVLAHRLGAAPEILDHPAMLMDCKDYKKVVDKVISWKNGDRPIVGPRREFSMPEVIRQWKRLLA